MEGELERAMRCNDYHSGTCLILRKTWRTGVEGDPDSANENLKRTIVQYFCTKCKENEVEVWFNRQTSAGA